MEKIRLFSAFSGIGAFEKALSELNIPFEVTGYSEIDKYASCAYSALHGISEDYNFGDISKVSPATLPDFDLFTYGFPCQDISSMGKQAGIVEGTTRSGLLHEALAIIKEKRPKVAIAENVKNLVGKNFIDDFYALLDRLESMGYKNYWKVMNAKEGLRCRPKPRTCLCSFYS